MDWLTLGTGAASGLLSGGVIAGVVSLMVSKREFKHNSNVLEFEKAKWKREENAEFRNSERAKRIADYYGMLDLIEDVYAVIQGHIAGTTGTSLFDAAETKLVAAERLVTRMRLHHSMELWSVCDGTLKSLKRLYYHLVVVNVDDSFGTEYEEQNKDFLNWQQYMVEKLRTAIQDEENK